MNKKQATLWRDALTRSLSNRNLVTVSAREKGVDDIRTRQAFKSAYIVQYPNGQCSVAVCDSYGVMTGAKKWEINPTKRSFQAEVTNGHGETLWFFWVIDEDDRGGILNELLASRDAINSAGKETNNGVS